MNEIYNKLKRPFDPKKISWRVGSTSQDKTKGIALAYIDARDVMMRLDEVFGLNWQNRYSHAEGKTICEIGAKIDGEWIWRAGGAGDTDIEAEKGAISDAFKRAAVLFGIGRYLYELPNEWVPIEPYGRSYKLSKYPSLPKWATPEGFDEIMRVKDVKGVVHKPTNNPDFNPDEEELKHLQGILDTILGLDKDYEAIKTYVKTQNMDADETTWIWNKLDSATRSGIKAVK